MDINLKTLKPEECQTDALFRLNSAYSTWVYNLWSFLYQTLYTLFLF